MAESTSSYEIVDVREVDPLAVLDAINQAFGRDLSPDWYAWKHLDGPWGSSRGWVAVDASGVLGTRLFVPWQLSFQAAAYDCARAMDGATVPRARRRGIFSALIKREMTGLAHGGSWTCLYSTSVPASREAYRGLGWTILPETRMVYRPLLPGRGTVQLDGAPDVDEQGPHALAQRLATAWTPAALRWRMDPRSGRTYRTAQLMSADGPHGLVFRVLRVRRLRVLAVVHGWGASSDLDRLLSATGRVMRCGALLEPAGPATRSLRPGRGVHAAGSTVSLWHNGAATGAPQCDVDDPSSWALDQADLEGVL